MAQDSLNNKHSVAYFAGGCFWCMEEAFEKQTGVIDAISGYTGGDFPNPTYEDISYKNTGHYEAIKVIYDSSKVSFDDLLELFWINVDPTQDNGQFCDKGQQYSSAIFFQDSNEKESAEKSKLKFQSHFKKINSTIQLDFVTKILPLKKFYDAEDYHQSYYKKNAIRYKTYKYLCGRSKRLSEIWGNR